MGGFSSSAGQAGELPPPDPPGVAVWGVVPTAPCTVQVVGRRESGALATGMPMSHTGHEILNRTTSMFTFGRDLIWANFGIIVESSSDPDAFPRSHALLREVLAGTIPCAVCRHMGLVGSFDVLPILWSHAGGSDEVVAATIVGNPSIGADIPAFGRGRKWSRHRHKNRKWPTAYACEKRFPISVLRRPRTSNLHRPFRWWLYRCPTS